MATSADKCPVDHKALRQECSGDSCPIDQGAHGASADKCPVDPSAQSSSSSSGGWGRLSGSGAAAATAPASRSARLPTDREVSSIPRVDGSNWVYPSQSQFYSAMERKNHNPHAPDMKVIVPIHNAVNERAWSEVMKWEAGQGGDQCGGTKLVSFKGRPKDRTPRAYWKMLLGCVSLFPDVRGRTHV